LVGLDELPLKMSLFIDHSKILTTHLTRCKSKASHTLALILILKFVNIVGIGFKAFTQGVIHEMDETYLLFYLL